MTGAEFKGWQIINDFLPSSSLRIWTWLLAAGQQANRRRGLDRNVNKSSWAGWQVETQGLSLDRIKLKWSFFCPSSLGQKFEVWLELSARVLPSGAGTVLLFFGFSKGSLLSLFFNKLARRPKMGLGSTEPRVELARAFFNSSHGPNELTNWIVIPGIDMWEEG